MFFTFLGPPTSLFDDLQYCKSSKNFWPHSPISLMTYIILEWSHMKFWCLQFFQKNELEIYCSFFEIENIKMSFRNQPTFTISTNHKLADQMKIQSCIVSWLVWLTWLIKELLGYVTMHVPVMCRRPSKTRKNRWLVNNSKI